MSKFRIHPWLRAWATRHHVSPEIAQAIHDVARDGPNVVIEGRDVTDLVRWHPRLPDKICDCPSEVEEGAVVYRAWELADDTEEVLHWGDEREYRRGEVR